MVCPLETAVMQPPLLHPQPCPFRTHPAPQLRSHTEMWPPQTCQQGACIRSVLCRQPNSRTCGGGPTDVDHCARAELSDCETQLVNWLCETVELHSPQVECVLDCADLNLVIYQADLLLFAVEVQDHAVVCGHCWAFSCTTHSSSSPRHTVLCVK